MCNHKGFTILELIVVVAVVAILASVSLPKFYRLTLRAEALSAQGMIGQLRSALSMQMARGLYRGDNLAAWAHDGPRALYPMRDLLLEQPENYLGVQDNSNKRGSWYDDKFSHELVYVVRNDEIVNGIAGVPKKVRWHISVIYDERQSDDIETLHAASLLGLVLQPSTPHKWLFE
ncbi:MAG: prepilin-type N-terminal cleavage/methylation domain-containing protein [Deltaproteobacteria bacterium]|nr:prepilin-type N-terminal cleavage/methylation domain-containing protein [Deltaproteobacteria bacterium]